jgi:peptidoglycan/LPS O-acetylase OafA/YrhL
MVNKNLALEGLRGIACINVLLAHFLFSFLPYLARYQFDSDQLIAHFRFEHWLAHAPFSLAFNGNAPVCIFFVLSGYVLTARFAATRDPMVLQSAALRRYLRLALPGFASVMFAWALLRLGWMWNQSAPDIGAAGWPMAVYKDQVGLGQAMFQGLFGAPLFGETSLNSPLWTLRIELIGSILLFAVQVLFAGRSYAVMAAWFVVLATALTRQSPFAVFYVAILLGSLLHPMTGWLRAHRWGTSLCLAAGLVLCAYEYSTAYAWLNGVRLPNLLPYAADLNADRRSFWNTLGAFFLVAGVVGSRTAGLLLANRILVYLGRISFALYLLHWPIICSLSFFAVKQGLDHGLSYAGAVALSLVLTIAVSILLSDLFYRWVDLPSIRFAARVEVLVGSRPGRGAALRREDSEPSRNGHNVGLNRVATDYTNPR